MKRLSTALVLLFLIQLMFGCSSPAPVPLGEGVQAYFRAHSETQWEVRLSLDPHYLEPQETYELCWAACVRMINRHADHGQSPTQQALHANHILTTPIHESGREMAYFNEVIDAMAGGYREQFNQRYIFDLAVNPDNLEKMGNPAYLDHREIVVALSSGEPVLFAMSASENSAAGHIGVIYGVKYEYVERELLDVIIDTVVDIFPSMMDTISAWADADDAAATGKPAAQSEALTQSTKTFAKIAEQTSSCHYRLVEVYYWDPADGVNEAGEPNGGAKVVSGEQFIEFSDFALTRPKALAYCEDRLQWAERQELGPGFYVRNPLSPRADPLLALGLEQGQDAELIGELVSLVFGTRDQSEESGRELEGAISGVGANQ